MIISRISACFFLYLYWNFWIFGQNYWFWPLFHIYVKSQLFFKLFPNISQPRRILNASLYQPFDTAIKKAITKKIIQQEFRKISSILLPYHSSISRRAGGALPPGEGTSPSGPSIGSNPVGNPAASLLACTCS